MLVAFKFHGHIKSKEIKCMINNFYDFVIRFR